MITLSLPRRIRKAAAHPDLPGAGLPVTGAIAAVPAGPAVREAPSAAAAQRPGPRFTPAPGALRKTRPIPGLAEAQQAWAKPAVAFTTAPGALRDAVRALRGDGSPRGEHPYPEAPAPAPRFTPRHRGRPSAGAVLRADRDELPVFRGTARSLGWRALLPAPAASGWVRYTTERWMGQAMAEVDRAVTLARMELASSAAEFAEVESRRAAAADAALFPVRHQ